MPPEATPLYAMFDGDEFNGKRYALGEEVKDLDAGTRTFLLDTGRISAAKPDTGLSFPAPSGKSYRDMSRAELEGALIRSVDFSRYSDEELIARLEANDEPEDDDQGDAVDTSETPPPAPTPPPSEPAAFDPAPVLAGTIPDVEGRLASITDRDQLDQLKAAEAAGADRSGVSKAIDARIAALSVD